MNISIPIGPVFDVCQSSRIVCSQCASQAIRPLHELPHRSGTGHCPESCARLMWDLGRCRDCPAAATVGTQPCLLLSHNLNQSNASKTMNTPAAEAHSTEDSIKGSSSLFLPLAFLVWLLLVEPWSRSSPSTNKQTVLQSPIDTLNSNHTRQTKHGGAHFPLPYISNIHMCYRRVGVTAL